jgi:hypothetical protein
VNIIFDPTAFDNMKVVIEGALYDMDIGGEIVITDRNDLVNLAKMSRCFDVSFTLPEGRENGVLAKIEMVSNLMNLAAELLPGTATQTEKKESGCQVKLHYFLEGIVKLVDYQAIESILFDIWGETRKVTQIVEYSPLDKVKKIKNQVTIEFERLISEEQMENLVEMIDFMITTIQHLQSFVSELK